MRLVVSDRVCLEEADFPALPLQVLLRTGASWRRSALARLIAAHPNQPGGLVREKISPLGEVAVRGALIHCSYLLHQPGVYEARAVSGAFDFQWIYFTLRPDGRIELLGHSPPAFLSTLQSQVAQLFLR